MAKVTPLPATPYRPALPLAILAALSVAFGIAIHIQDFHRVPGYWAPQAKLLSGRQLQASLGVDYGYYEPLKLLFVLVGFFEHTLREKTALGVSSHSAARSTTGETDMQALHHSCRSCWFCFRL